MNKRKSTVYIVIITFLLLVGIIISFHFIRAVTEKDKDLWEEFRELLNKNEVIIDGIQDNTIVYMITSKEGRSEYGDTLVVFQKEAEEGWRRIYENDFKDLKPWKIELSDIDGDGTKEILTAVRKTTYFDKTEKNRMFIFNYEENKLTKKWTGSEIAGIWDDFIAGDFLPVPGDELIFVSRTELGEHLCVYYWFGFGFRLLTESDDYEDIRDISIYGENCICMTYQEEGKEKEVFLTSKDGKLLEVTEEK